MKDEGVQKNRQVKSRLKGFRCWAYDSGCDSLRGQAQAHGVRIASYGALANP